MEHIVEEMIRKSTLQAVEYRIEHQQVVLQILKMSTNMMKLQTYHRHRQRSFEVGKVV